MIWLLINYELHEAVTNSISCVITYFYKTPMSRGNVFKLSGNMALGGGGSDYQNVDIDEIKNSLKLLKAKKNRQSGTADSQPSYGGSYGGYGNSYGNSNQKSMLKAYPRLYSNEKRI